MQLDLTTPDQPEGEFAYLCRELRRRTAEFPKRFSFIVYVLVAILGLGALGIWTELVKVALSGDPGALNGLFTATTTFYPAVVASATFQLLLIAAGKNDRVMTAFGVLTMVFFLAAALLLSIFRATYPTLSLTAATILAVFSVWIWIVANADDPIYKPVSPDAASGGNPSRDPKGDLSEFTVD